MLDLSDPALHNFLLIAPIALLWKVIHRLELVSAIVPAIGEDLLQGRILAQAVFVVVSLRVIGALLLRLRSPEIDTKLLS